MSIDLTRPGYAEAFTSYLLGDWAQARLAFEKLSAAEPGDPFLSLILGNTYYSMGELDRAEEQYEKALELKPDFGPAYYKLGVAYYRHGKLEKSLESFNRILALQDQSHAMASYFVGLINSFLGNDEGALKGFSLLRQASPDSRIANYYLAQLKVKQGQYEEALELLDELLKITPKLAEVHYQRGVVLMRLHRNSEAVASFRRTLELNPNDRRAKAELHLVTGIDDL